jgi:hypothetical protein
LIPSGRKTRIGANDVFITIAVRDSRRIVGKPGVIDGPRGQVLVSSIKEEVKKKHFSFGWNFSCFAAHLIERDLF